MPDDGPIELSPRGMGKPPRLPGEVVLREDPDSAIDALTADLSLHASNCVRRSGSFHLAISPGGPIEKVLRRLMLDPDLRLFPWHATFVWLADEQRVPHDDPRSSFGLVRDMLIDHSGMPARHLRELDLAHADPAQAYAAELRSMLVQRGEGQERLDSVLLSLRGDGGVGGVFARTTLTVGGMMAITPGDAASGQADVLAMTPTVFNTARFVQVLAAGPECGLGTRRVAEARRAGVLGAATGAALEPVRGDLRWYMDQSAILAAEGGGQP